MAITLSDKLTLNPGVHIRPEVFGGVVYNPETKEIFKVTKLGFFVLKLCNGKYTLQELVDKLGQRLEISQPSFSTDVLSFADKLLSNGIIVLES